MSKDSFKDFASSATRGVTTATPAVAASPSPRAIIEKWWHERVHGSPIARDIRSYNFLYAAIEDLKRLFEHQE